MLSFMLVSLVGGCRKKIVVTGISIHESYWQRAVESLEERASFDLDCPTDQLSYRLFGKVGRHASHIGVEGCGNRAAYVGGYGGWLRDDPQEREQE